MFIHQVAHVLGGREYSICQNGAHTLRKETTDCKDNEGQ